MNRVAIVKVHRCAECPFIRTYIDSEDGDYHYYVCDQLDIASKNVDGSEESEIEIVEQLKDWFRNLCPLEFDFPEVE